MSQILTAVQAAEYLHISTDVIYRMASRGEIPTAKVGGQWRFVDTDLVEWLRSQYHEAARVPSLRVDTCHTKEKAQTNGGLPSVEYANLLGLKSTKTRRLSNTN